MGPVAVAALSGLFAGGVATLVTWAVENFGGLLGGVLGTLPTTIIPATLGIAISVNAGRGGDHSDGNKELMQAGFAVPLSMLADVVFLLQWRVWPDRLGGGGVSFSCKLASMIGVSMGIWLLAGGCAFGVSELGATMGVGGTVTVGTIGLVVAVGLGIWTTWDHHPAPKGANRVSWAVMLARGVFAGLAIFVSVLAGRTSSVLAGILAAFPAIFLTTMVAVWLAQGEAVTTGAVGPMMLGSCSVSVYAMLYSILVGTAGKWGSMVLCWPLSVLVTSVPIVLYLRWREEVYEEYGPSGGTSGAGGHHVRLEEMEAEAFAVVGSGAAGRGSRGSSFGFGGHGAGQPAAGVAGGASGIDAHIDALRGAEAGGDLDRQRAEVLVSSGIAREQSRELLGGSGSGSNGRRGGGVIAMSDSGGVNAGAHDAARRVVTDDAASAAAEGDQTPDSQGSRAADLLASPRPAGPGSPIV